MKVKCSPIINLLGVVVPHNQTLELKSGSGTANTMEQLWFGRCPNLCLGNHRQGMITAPTMKHHSKSDFVVWETSHQVQLQKLVWFLEELRHITVEKSIGGAAVLVSIEKGAPLQVFEQRVKTGGLPEEIIERFWDRAI